MNMTDCPWLMPQGPDTQIAVSTRVRLARNIADYVFPTHPDESDRRDVLDRIHRAMDSLATPFTWHELDEQSGLDRLLLVERHLISRELADKQGPRALAVCKEESLAVMVNEEDHLRMQCIMPGLQPQEAYDRVNRLDDRLGEKLSFAYSPKYGFLTSCPTNMGTGLRVSVMLHLPALVMTKHIEKVFRAVQAMRMAVRGFYGEGTDAWGELYQISNQATCGMAEMEIIDDMNSVIKAIIKYEQNARIEMAGALRTRLQDRIWRSWGILSGARVMSTEEAMSHLSSLRLGAALGLFDRVEPERIQRLFLECQPGHLQVATGVDLSNADQRDITRASYLRRELTGCE